MSEATGWKMPEWMESYRELFDSTGGLRVEHLMTLAEDTEKRRGLKFSNEILWLLAITTAAQVDMLTALHKRGHLAGEVRVPIPMAEELPRLHNRAL